MSPAAAHENSAAPPRAAAVPAFVLGLALGGFFDGILLHQVLEWHHFLSNVEAARDLRVQLLADGLFHMLMYIVAMVALWLLWKRRGSLAAPGSSATVVGAAWLGFAAWQAVDVVLAHWIVGIHRVRVDVPNPLAWDIGWLVVFGVPPLIYGWRRWKGGGGGTGGRSAAALAIAVVLSGAVAARAPASDDQQLVLFGPGTSSAQAFDALARVDARVLWVDQSGAVWAVKMPPSASRTLYGAGALLVSDAAVALGCLSFTRL